MQAQAVVESANLTAQVGEGGSGARPAAEPDGRGVEGGGAVGEAPHADTGHLRCAHRTTSQCVYVSDVADRGMVASSTLNPSKWEK